MSDEESGVIKRAKKDQSCTVPRFPIEDESISWEAAGMLSYLLSRPDDWVTRNQDLINKRPAGKHKVKRILAELRAAGYIHRSRNKAADGRFIWVTLVYEVPGDNPHHVPMARKAVDGKPGHILKDKELPIGNSLSGGGKEPKEKPKTRLNQFWDVLVLVTSADPSMETDKKRLGKACRELAGSNRNYDPSVIAGLFGTGKGNWYYNVRQANIVEKQKPSPESVLKFVGMAYDWYIEKKAKQAAAPAEQSAVLSQIYQNSQL